MSDNETSYDHLPNVIIVRVVHRVNNFIMEDNQRLSGFTEIKDIDRGVYPSSFVDSLLRNGFFVEDLKTSSSSIDSGMYVMEIYRLRRTT